MTLSVARPAFRGSIVRQHRAAAGGGVFGGTVEQTAIHGGLDEQQRDDGAGKRWREHRGGSLETLCELSPLATAPHTGSVSP